MTRRERAAELERLRDRPGPWTDEQWREWAAVAAADVLDRGYARIDRDPETGAYLIDRAFSVGHAPGKGRSSVMVVGPGWDAFTREVGSRAASHAIEARP